MKQIPNIITCFRFLLLAAFAVVFFRVSPVLALPLMLLSGISDMLDGYLARRNNWVTALGKILDPLADKAMHFTALICLMAAGMLHPLLALPFFIKEAAQLVCGLLMLRRRDYVAVSRWYGKATGILFYCTVFFTVPVRVYAADSAWGDPAVLAVWLFTIAASAAVFVNYIVLYARLAARLKRERKETSQGDGEE